MLKHLDFWTNKIITTNHYYITSPRLEKLFDPKNCLHAAHGNRFFFYKKYKKSTYIQRDMRMMVHKLQ